MIVIQIFLKTALKLCLAVDKCLLKTVDLIISWRGWPVQLFSGRLFSGRVWAKLSNFSFLKRGVAYSLLSIFLIAVGVYCSGDDTPEKLSKPGKVANFEVTSGDGIVHMSWELSKDASTYMIFMDNDSGDSMFLEMYPPTGGNVAQKPSIDLSKGLNDAQMLNGKKYAFQILAKNDQGDGAKSNKKYAMPRPTSLTSLAGGVTANKHASEQVILTWSPVNLATKYVISRKSGMADYQKIADLEKDQICSTTTQLCTYVDMGLTNGTPYDYKVIAVMAIGIDDNDLENAEVKSSDALASATPTLLLPTQVKIRHTSTNINGPVNGGATVTLTITPPATPSATVTGYKIETLNPDGTAIPNSNPIEIDISNQNTTLHDVNQPFGVTRRYRITAQSGTTGARNDIPDSANVDDVSGVLPAIPVASGFIASGVTDKVATLQWSKAGTATHYTLKRSVNGTPTLLFMKRAISEFGTGAQYTYQDTHNLGSGQQYQYTLAPIISTQNISDVQGTNLTVNGTTPTEDASLTQFVDPFIGTEYSHTHSYQPTRVYPVASVPFGMVVFTPVNAFHSGKVWHVPNNMGSSLTRGRQLPTYVGLGAPRSYIKGFSAFSFQGPGCNIAHDFLMMATTTAASGNNQWLSNTAHETPNHNDYKIKEQYGITRSQSDRNTLRENNDEEWAEPGYYRVKTKNNTLMEISATKRTGIMKITYPATASSGYFHLASYTRADDFDDRNSFTQVKSINSETRGLKAQVRAGTFCGEGDSFKYQIFMSGEFNRVYSSPVVRPSDDNEIKVKFDLSSGSKIVIYKFGLSYVSYTGAKKNMIGASGVTGENTGFDFNLIKTQSKVVWNEFLSKIKVRDSHDGTGTHYQTRTSPKRRLYTFLFRSLLHPNIFSDVDKRYVGFNGSSVTGRNRGAIHTLPATQKDQYQYFSNWDIYRSQTPLVAFLQKDIARDIVRSLVNNANQAGLNNNAGGFTRWGVANHDSGVMGGDPASIMISDSDAFGATLSLAEDNKIIQVFNRSGKLNELDLKGCNHQNDNLNQCQLDERSSTWQGGAVTNNIRSGSLASIKSLLIDNNAFSKIIELAHADYARSSFIYRSLNDHRSERNSGNNTRLLTKARQFKASSDTWRQLFRSGRQASFKARTTQTRRIHQSPQCLWFGRDGHKCYHEGNAIQYEWSFPYDMAGRFAEGNEANRPINGFVENTKVLTKLKRHFFARHLISGETGRTYNAGNQVGFGTPYVYHYIGRPNETLRIVRKELGNKYWTDNTRTYPGNEDGGSMSAQFIWSFVGLYPHAHGTDRLLLLYPAFDYIEFDLSDGSLIKKLILKRDPASTVASDTEDACVEGVTADGIDIDLGTDQNIQNDYAWTQNYIRYRNITASTTLSFKIKARPTLSTTPPSSGDCITGTTATVWGRKPADIPPSNLDY